MLGPRYAASIFVVPLKRPGYKKPTKSVFSFLELADPTSMLRGPGHSYEKHRKKKGNDSCSDVYCDSTECTAGVAVHLLKRECMKKDDRGLMSPFPRV